MYVTSTMSETFNARKSTYKHISIADSSLSQQSRRAKALEEQKRRRARKVDASRQLDSFADLTLGSSDEDDDKKAPRIVHQGLASFVNNMEPSTHMQEPMVPEETSRPTQPARKSKKKRQGRVKKQDPARPNEWADKCMYAELLEMNVDDSWGNSDGLPEDLETGWVAVAPVPVGKRCLAISQQGIGVVPNTTLRSRALGKPLMPRFPSNLPPHTVLDCILDPNWRENGILHVLDVIKWKEQDISECETPFRFWWRDTRLAELTQSPPPSMSYSKGADTASQKYRFSYPTTLLPIPHYTNTSLSDMANTVVPAARLARFVSVQVPVCAEGEGMELDSGQSVLTEMEAVVSADGLLLYVAEASYESGASPLSNWVPIRSYGDNSMDSVDSEAEAPLDRFHRLVQRRMGKQIEEARADDEMDL